MATNKIYYRNIVDLINFSRYVEKLMFRDSKYPYFRNFIIN